MKAFLIVGLFLIATNSFANVCITHYESNFLKVTCNEGNSDSTQIEINEGQTAIVTATTLNNFLDKGYKITSQSASSFTLVK